MSDPAIEAAERQLREQFGHDWHLSDGYTLRVRTDAAREALAPLRERHKPVGITVRRQGFEPEIQLVCDHCDGGFQSWPCDDARDIYPSEEL